MDNKLHLFSNIHSLLPFIRSNDHSLQLPVRRKIKYDDVHQSWPSLVIERKVDHNKHANTHPFQQPIEQKHILTERRHRQPEPIHLISRIYLAGAIVEWACSENQL